MEEWRDILGKAGRYQASSLGRIKSLSRITVRRNGYPIPVQEKVLSPCLNKAGYFVVCIDGKKTEIHRLITPAFLGERQRGQDIDHIDRDKENNAVVNLRYTSRSKNVRNTDKYGSKTSRFTGVYFLKRTKKWQAQIKHGGKNRVLGSHITEQQAARAYDSYCVLNNLDRELNHA